VDRAAFWDRNSGVDAICGILRLDDQLSHRVRQGHSGRYIINATTKSGTNQFHGTGYEFSFLLFFCATKLVGCEKFLRTIPTSKIPEFQAETSSAPRQGGPIIKEQEPLFSGDYEGLRQALGITTN